MPGRADRLAASIRAACRIGARLPLAALALLFSLAGAAHAAGDASPPATAAEAPVVVFNRTVVVYRAAFIGISPQERARRTAGALREVLARDGPGEVRIEPSPQGQVIKIDGAFAFVVTPDDADRLRNETAEAAAQRAAGTLAEVLEAARESRRPARIARSLGLATAATLVALGLLWVVVRVRRRIAARLLDLAHAHADQLHARGAGILQREHLIDLARWAATVVFWLLALLVAYEWLGTVLSLFPWTRPWGAQLNDYLLGVASGIAGGILRALPDLLVAVVIFVIARLAVSLLRPFFDRIETTRERIGWLDAETVGPTRRIATVVVWLFALVMAYPYLPGAHTEAFKGLSVLVGLMISLGASSLVGQAASGLILIYTRTLRPGEYVRVGENEGTVMEVGMFATRVRTGLGEELTLPNALVMSSVTRNYSRAVQGSGYIVDTAVTIGYDVPWRQVHALLVEAARRTPGVLAEPAPRVFQTALSDFYVEYRLVAQAAPVEPRTRAELLDALHANVQDCFNEQGVQIMSPHYLGDPAEAKVVPRARWYEPPARPGS